VADATPNPPDYLALLDDNFYVVGGVTVVTKIKEYTNVTPI